MFPRIGVQATPPDACPNPCADATDALPIASAPTTKPRLMIVVPRSPSVMMPSVLECENGGRAGSDARAGIGDNEDHAADDGDDAEDGRQRNLLVLLLGRLNRTDLEHLFRRRVPDAADDERDDAEGDQQNADELHVPLHLAEMHAARQTSTGRAGRIALHGKAEEQTSVGGQE